MTLDDVVIPNDIGDAIRQASATLPAQAWDLDALKKRANSSWRLGRWRWSRKLTGIAAGAVAAIVAGSGALVVTTGGGTQQTESRTQLSVYAADADHLYAIWTDCPDSCTTTMLASEDNGATWTRRTDPGPPFRFSVTPDGAVFAETAAGDPVPIPFIGLPEGAETAVSADGGRTWKSVVYKPEPWQELPTGGLLACGAQPNCRLSAVDPTTGRQSPLPQQPTVKEFRFWFAAGKVIWLDGPGGDKLETTVSRDGGHSWSTQSQACATDCEYRLTPGLDGTTVYRVRFANTTSTTEIRRSTDSGKTWQSFSPAGSSASVPSPGTTGIVAPDGSFIVARFNAAGAAPEAWALAPTDPQPRPVRLAGLPDHIGFTEASGLTGSPDAGYLLKPVEGDVVYRSLDGLTWWPLPIPRL